MLFFKFAKIAIFGIYSRFVRGGTRLGTALKLAKKRLFQNSPQNRKKALIVLTDGLSADNVLGPIQQLAALKVVVTAVGVGPVVKKAQHQLLTIAKDPQHLYLTDVNGMDSLVARISKKTCYGETLFKSWSSIYYVLYSL